MDLEFVLGEWSSIAVNKSLKRREFDIDKVISNSKNRVVSITGIRRSGKSSVLMLLYRQIVSLNEKVIYINLEDNRLKFADVLDEIVKYSPETKWFILDEITSIPRWDNWIHRIAEMKTINLIVSSSLNKLSKTPPKPLRGRVTYFELFPLSFSEFIQFKGIELIPTIQGMGKIERLLEEFLVYGGFPEVVLLNEKTQILQEYLNSIVALDVTSFSNIPFTIISDFTSQLIGMTMFSASKMENLLKSIGHKIGKSSILELEDLFEIAYLAFFVPIFSTNMKDEKQYPRKVYFGDTGFFYASQGKKDFGRLYENAVFLHLRRNLKQLEQISYYKSKEGYEVDFVIRLGNQVKKLIQVAYSIDEIKTKKRETNTLMKAAKEFNIDGKNTNLLIITKSYEEKEQVDGKTISYIPLWKFLLATK